jgi:hypothetical protein
LTTVKSSVSSLLMKNYLMITLYNLPSTNMGTLFYGTNALKFAAGATSMNISVSTDSSNKPIQFQFVTSESSRSLTADTFIDIDYTVSLFNSQSELISVSSKYELSFQIFINVAPVVGTGGNCMRMKGSDWGFSDSFYWPAYPNVHSATASGVSGPSMTLEMWVYIMKNETGYQSCFGITNSEICEFSNGETCHGRFQFCLPWEDGTAYFDYGSTLVQRNVGPLNEYWNRWTHIAWTSCGDDHTSTGCEGGIGSLYYNGKIIDQNIGTMSPWHQLNGLWLGHWPFYDHVPNNEADIGLYTSIHNPNPLLKHLVGYSYMGMVDEFKIWTRVLTQNEIVNNMHKKLKGDEPNLWVYYDFDFQPGDPEDGITIPDRSNNHFDLVFGGCPHRNETMYKSPCELTPEVRAMKIDDHIPYARSSLLPSTVAVGGYENSLVTKGSQTLLVQLHAYDTNIFDILTFIITKLPDTGRGQLVHVNNGQTITTVPVTLTSNTVYYKAPANVGGWNFASFQYVAFDGQLTSTPQDISLSVTCEPGSAPSAVSNSCMECNAGYYQPNSKNEACLACPAGTFSTSTGATQCETCPIGTAQPTKGSTTCQICDPDNGKFGLLSGQIECNSCTGNEIYVKDQNGNGLCKLPVLVQNGAQIAIYVLAGIIIFCVLAVFTILMVYLRSRTVYRASPVFLTLVLVGIILFCITGILLALKQTPGICTAKVWTFNIGFQFIFTSLFVKMHRLHLIFNNPKLTTVRVRDSELLKQLSIFLCIDMLVMAIWSGISPFTIFSAELPQCSTEHDIPFVGVLIITKCAILLACVYITYQLRGIPSEYNDTK